MPLRAVAAPAHHFAVEGFPLPLRRVLEHGTGFDGGFHGGHKVSKPLAPRNGKAASVCTTPSVGLSQRPAYASPQPPAQPRRVAGLFPAADATFRAGVRGLRASDGGGGGAGGRSFCSGGSANRSRGVAAHPHARLDEDEGALLRDARQRAGVVLNKLLAAGWIEEQTLGLQDRRIVVAPGLRLLMGMLRALAQDEVAELRTFADTLRGVCDTVEEREGARSDRRPGDEIRAAVTILISGSFLRFRSCIRWRN